MKKFFKNYVKERSLPFVMGILNVTPDSFSDGGKFYEQGVLDLPKTMEVAVQMVKDGANILDIGGESSGPGSKDVSLKEELKRVLPVVMAIKDSGCVSVDGSAQNQAQAYESLKSFSVFEQNQVLVSVDTYKAEVARQALKVGADMINDVTALRGDPEMAKILAEFQAPVVLMYSKDPTARTTRTETHYDDVMKTIHEFFEERIAFAVAQGIARENIILDPGMGAFISMDPKYSLEILKRLAELQDFGLPILVGASRKGFIGQVLAMCNEECGMKNEELRMIAADPLQKKGRGPDCELKTNLPATSYKLQANPLPASERLEGSLACAAVAVMNGASIVRVHDVQQTRRVVDMVCAIKNV